MRPKWAGRLALTIRPLATSSRAYARSPVTPLSSIETVSTRSPSIDLTGYRHSSPIDHMSRTSASPSSAGSVAVVIYNHDGSKSDSVAVIATSSREDREVEPAQDRPVPELMRELAQETGT